MTSEQETFNIDSDLLDAVIADLTEYAADGCDHSVGICCCDLLGHIEELKAIREHRDPWWVTLDKLMPTEPSTQ